MNDNHKSSMLSQIHKTMHNDVLRLDRKIKGLQAEINAKIDSMSQENDTLSLKHKKYLNILSEEISKAINSIQSLVTLVAPKGAGDDTFLKMNLEELEALHQVVKENTDKITKIQEQL